MNSELLSLLLSILSSLVALISVFLVRKAAKSVLEENKIVLKNDKGEVREIFAEIGDSKNEYSAYLNEAIDFEKFVFEKLVELNLNVKDKPQNSMDKGYDFLFEKDGELVAVEVKSHKKPLSANTIKDYTSRLPSDIAIVFFISKSGFSSSAIELLEKYDKKVSLIDGSIDDLGSQLSSALVARGITRQLKSGPKTAG